MKKINKLFSAFLLLLCLPAFGARAFAEGSAPVAENLELRTFRNVSVGGRLNAFDPDDDVVSYTITTEPVKGSIEVEENGCFVYTPKENKRGRDYFGYKAVDSEGNLSQEATVIIRIERHKKSAAYTDLEGQACGYAAAVLSDAGIFTGERLASGFCFCPEKPVSRGEFLSLCLALKNRPPLEAVLKTMYRDDEAIPVWVKGCCAAAQLAGIAPKTDELQASAPITAEEANEWLNQTLALTEISYLQPEPGQTQAYLNLTAHGIPAPAGADVLTRGEAARMLAAALALKSK